MSTDDRTCRTCAGFNNVDGERLGMCLRQHSPEYFCIVLETHTCQLWHRAEEK